jgi:hypothetical protein
MEPTPHFTPWQATARLCWHCSRFIGLAYRGSAASCKLVNGPRVRSMPAAGCASFEREVGADDEPDQVPADLRTVAPHGGQSKAQAGPPWPRS